MRWVILSFLLIGFLILLPVFQGSFKELTSAVQGLRENQSQKDKKKYLKERVLYSYLLYQGTEELILKEFKPQDHDSVKELIAELDNEDK